ncbi:hypothetical protein [Lactiplantibacillus paraxiangfangensis]|uniref:hypothetical protein n=1 Tax=Lactiplantibacillus paraxiangfangensis TaxID=3076224 RepID=UPI0030C6D6BF
MFEGLAKNVTKNYREHLINELSSAIVVASSMGKHSLVWDKFPASSQNAITSLEDEGFVISTTDDQKCVIDWSQLIQEAGYDD